MTGLNPFTLAHCGPSPPCVRFAASVTDSDATLGFDHRVGHCGVLHMMAEPMRASCLRYWGIPNVVREEGVWR